jgi:bacteriorhodopsin
MWMTEAPFSAVLFANLALATLYMMQRQWGVDGPATISSANSGRPLPWLQYGEWLFTFPPLLAAVADLTGVGRRKWGRGMALLGAFLVALFMGVTAAYSSGTAPKVAFVSTQFQQFLVVFPANCKSIGASRGAL